MNTSKEQPKVDCEVSANIVVSESAPSLLDKDDSVLYLSSMYCTVATNQALLIGLLHILFLTGKVVK